MFAALRFLWNATRGHRLAPWRSDFIKWRIETFSGQKAETLALADVFRFTWSTRAELFRFLVWTGTIERTTRRQG